MGDVSKSNKKLVWYILFAFVTVIFCYLFVVVYFCYISPYNISARIALWPFVSEQQIGEMYSEATVKVTFSYVNDDFEPDEVSVNGVNVDKEGYILFPFSEIDECSDYSKIRIMTASGTVYNGKFVYGDKDFNLALVKCESANGKKIKIPYVRAYDDIDYSVFDRVIIATSKLDNKNVWTGNVSDTDKVFIHKTKNSANETVYDYNVEGGFVIKINGYGGFGGGAVFDSRANLLGFSYTDTLAIEEIDEGKFFIMPAYSVNYVLDGAKEAYRKNTIFKNKVISKLDGFDKTEAEVMHTLSKNGLGMQYYFKGDWQDIPDEYDAFLGDGVNGFYLYSDFVYGDKTIAKNCVITGVSVNRTRLDIEYKVDLFSAIYEANTKSDILIYYQRYDSVGHKFVVADQPVKISL